VLRVIVDSGEKLTVTLNNRADHSETSPKKITE